MLWFTEFGIWPSSENWNLYNKLRMSYGETASLSERPGHLFAGEETDDLLSFFQLSALFGWGGYLLTEANHINAFFSHDEFIDLFSSERRLIDQLHARLSR